MILIPVAPQVGAGQYVVAAVTIIQPAAGNEDSDYSSEEVGMFARVSIYEVPTERVGPAAETFGQAIGQIRGMTGLAAAYLLVNAENGANVDHDALGQPRSHGSKPRDRVTPPKRSSTHFGRRRAQH